ncbi:hypothetical protein ART_1407 [Arthrobacter sp. PAMC 25486]|uniref:DUF202 domain-containing protein n=1 Tax=Arthrobacter sp. PAMC 25486 TaxID=1494608 RepID=UPI0005360F1C|nr:DUF202 domain-containing protein [Arthrobacter sp. PAMC 25486]AIY01006.1 hypothetical protein ART_1407 [Arthrobacter sp. PAMC 25486]
MAPFVVPVRDPGLQPERTALSWRRTIMSAVVADVLIWRGWFQALTGASGDGFAGAGLAGSLDSAAAGGHGAQVVGLGICAAVACLTTIILVFCAVSRVRLLHAGIGPLESEAHIAAPALILRTASAAIVALAAATVCALALGM